MPCISGFLSFVLELLRRGIDFEHFERFLDRSHELRREYDGRILFSRYLSHGLKCAQLEGYRVL